MATQRVTRSGKDNDGDITSLCGAWGSVTKDRAIREIDGRPGTYFVEDRYGRRADVIVVDRATVKYLRTAPNAVCSDNLDNLPDC